MNFKKTVQSFPKFTYLFKIQCKESVQLQIFWQPSSPVLFVHNTLAPPLLCWFVTFSSDWRCPVYALAASSTFLCRSSRHALTQTVSL